MEFCGSVSVNHAGFVVVEESESFRICGVEGVELVR